MRTTIDLDGPILRELKRLQKVEGKSLGRLASDLLAGALASRKAEGASRSEFRWVARPMRALVDISDKEAVQAALDQAARHSTSGR